MVCCLLETDHNSDWKIDLYGSKNGFYYLSIILNGWFSKSSEIAFLVVIGVTACDSPKKIYASNWEGNMAWK